MRRSSAVEDVRLQAPEDLAARCCRWASSALCTAMALVFIGLAPGSESMERHPAPQAGDLSMPASREWPTVGGDWNNTRYSKLSQINVRNVKRLQAAWVSSAFEEGATSFVTPVVRDGMMFVTAGRWIYALNAKTGTRLWSYATAGSHPADDTERVSRKTVEYSPDSIEGVPNWKGVGVGGGLVFVGLLDGHVIALSEKTGRLVWSQQTGIAQPKTGQWAAVAPSYVDGNVFTGLSDGDHHLRGRLVALDAKTGSRRWDLFSIPGPGEPGHETWPSFNEAWRFGGGGVWTTPAVDRELGLVYVTTGNAVPPFAGDWRPGDNLYTSSVLAVDLRTGKLRWWYQLVHHDVFEADVGTPVVLFDADTDGKARKALAVLRADGYLFQLDRRTGQPLVPVEERLVPQLAAQQTSPTQPFPVGAESFLMSCDEWKKAGIPAGFTLGCMWTPPASPPPSTDPQNVLAPVPSVKGSPMAYSPQTGYFYAQGLSTLGWPRRSQDPYFENSSSTVPGLGAYGNLAAIDGRTGKVVWNKRMPTALLGGAPLATAGGLVFRCAGDGNIEAHDARTGDLSWTFQTGMGSAGGPPATYEIDGEQYIAVAMGPVIWAFKLGGAIYQAPTPGTSTEDEGFSGPVVDTDEIDTTSLERSLIEPGMRYFIDEYTFSPYRARVTAGTKVLFVNNGNLPHEIVAFDGSWGTGPLSPTEEAWVSFDRPGEYVYICKEHPWSYGEIIVQPDVGSTTDGRGAKGPTDALAERAIRGRDQFNRNCGSCHGEDLLGRAPAPALIGNAFLRRWENAEIGDLFDKIRTTMPQAKPGGLDRQTYLDIVAYLLSINNLTPPAASIEDARELKLRDIGTK